jgi:hypothetical protein
MIYILLGTHYLVIFCLEIHSIIFGFFNSNSWEMSREAWISFEILLRKNNGRLTFWFYLFHSTFFSSQGFQICLCLRSYVEECSMGTLQNLCLQDLTPMGSHFRATSIVKLSEGTGVAFPSPAIKYFSHWILHIGVVVGGWNGLSTKGSWKLTC